MKKVILTILIILNQLYAGLISIPDDYQTIQMGINAAADGDTVLVYPDVYIENLIIDKSITLAGIFLIDGDPSNIENTVINGSSPQDDALGSTIFITPPIGGFNSQPQIIGLTVFGGSGTQFTDTFGFLHSAGGGVFIHNCTPTLNYVHFKNNGFNEATSNRVDMGGAIYISIDEGITFDHLNSYSPWIGPYIQSRDEIDLDWCQFENNLANIGKSIVAHGFSGTLLTTNNIFDVFNSTVAAASSYWVVADDETEFDYFCSTGMVEALTMPEIHIHEEDGSNETGDGSDNNPFQDIAHALSLAYGTDEHPVTIHLDNVRNRRERPREFQYPLQMVDHVSLKGEGDRSTVLDADDQSKILLFENVNGVKIDSLKLSHGRDANQFGGAVYINESNPHFTSVTFDENEGTRGGALFVNKSEPIFQDVEFLDNVSERGGGLYIHESNVVLYDIELSDNEVISTRDEFENGYGGGFYLDNSCIDIDNVVIQNNTVLSNNGSSGGGAIYGSMPEDDEDYYCQNDITLELSNVIIKGNSAETGSGIYLKNISAASIDHVQISGNVMTESNANGVIYLSNSTDVNLDHLTISGNYANGFAPVMYMAYSNANITNSIVYGNGSAIPLAWGFYCQEASQLSVQYSNIENGLDAFYSGCDFDYDGTNIEPADPLFVEGLTPSSSPSIAGDFHLQSESSCIDAGDPEYTLDSDGTITDIGMYPCEFCGVSEIEGCMDPTACNYDPLAVIDNGSCEGPAENFDCDGNCLIEEDCLGECGGAAMIDECGVCDGGGVVQECGCGLPGEFGIPDGACDCGGNNDCDGIYFMNLFTGNNLISFPGIPSITDTEELMESLEDQCGNQVGYLVGQGVGHFQLSDGNWNGNLNSVTPISGYWINVSSECNWALQLAGDYSDGCLDYPVDGGNNLISYVGQDGAESLDALGQNTNSSTLNFGNLDEHFNFIITEGRGSFNYCSGEGVSCWSGNLNEVYLGNGYWINIGLNEYPYETFRWNIGNGCDAPTGTELQKTAYNNPAYTGISDEFQFIQSTQQAFYLIKDMKINGQNPQIGDIILAYNDDVLVGSVEYDGAYTPVPVMGRDISPQTEGFCEVGDIPEFKLLKTNSSEIIDLQGDLPGWTSLGVYTVESLIGSTVEIPSKFTLYPASPNPFNPTTTIRYDLPVDSEVSLTVYDIEGRQIKSLVNTSRPAGSHQVEWNAKDLPSGVYFMKLSVGEFSQSQKLMLVK